MTASIWLACVNTRYTAVEMMNPGGTGKPPRAVRARFIPLPPACSRVMASALKGRMNACMASTSFLVIFSG